MFTASTFESACLRASVRNDDTFGNERGPEALEPMAREAVTGAVPLAGLRGQAAVRILALQRRVTLIRARVERVGDPERGREEPGEQRHRERRPEHVQPREPLVHRENLRLLYDSRFVKQVAGSGCPC